MITQRLNIANRRVAKVWMIKKWNFILRYGQVVLYLCFEFPSLATVDSLKETKEKHFKNYKVQFLLQQPFLYFFVQLISCLAIRLFNLNESQKWWIKLWINLLVDRFPQKNSRRHNSIYNIYWLLTRFKFVWLLTQLFPSNLEVNFYIGWSYNKSFCITVNKF